jgi:hypothetical protein
MRDGGDKEARCLGNFHPVNAFCSFKDILGTIVNHLP